MASSLKQAVHHNLECPICLSLFKEPKILTCSHTFCKGCLETLLETHPDKEDLSCPTCGEETLIPGRDVDRLQTNITVRSLVEDVETQSQVCSNCNPEDKTLAVAFCNECGKYLCESCRIVHSKWDNFSGHFIVGISDVSQGFKLGQLRQKESKWVLQAQEQLPVADSMDGMVVSPKNMMAIGCYKRGIFIYSAEGILQETVLKTVKVRALQSMPDGGYAIRDTDNRIFLYTELCEKLDVVFDTLDDAKGGDGGLTVDSDGLILTSYMKYKIIHVLKPEGGKAIREILCDRSEPLRIFAMISSKAIVMKNGYNTISVIDSVSGATINSITKGKEFPFPVVCKDDSVIIAWVTHDQGRISIDQYTKDLKHTKNILADFKITKPSRNWYYLQQFKTGEIALCTPDKLYIFHELWKYII